MASAAIRVDEDLYADARSVGALMSRSAQQQLTHWARLGRALEASSSSSAPRIVEVLSGTSSYDDLTASEQAQVRTVWEEQLHGLDDGMDLSAELDATGVASSELDATGALVTRDPSPARRRRPRAGA